MSGTHPSKYQQAAATVDDFTTTHYTSSSRPTTEKLHELIGNFSPDKLVPVLQEIVNTPELLEDIAKRSYRHPNGFHVLTLFESKHGSEVRFHVWLPDTEIAPENVHLHRWDMISFPLTAGFENHLFQIRSDISPEKRALLKIVSDRLDQLPEPEKIKIYKDINHLQLLRFGTENELKQANIKIATPQETTAQIGLLETKLVRQLGITYRDLETILYMRRDFIMPPRDLKTGLYTPIPAGIVEVERTEVQKIKPGEPYYMDAGVLHKVVTNAAEQGLTATIVFLSPPVSDHTRFLEQLYEEPRPTRDAGSYKPEQVRDTIMAYLEAIGQTPAPNTRAAQSRIANKSALLEPVLA